MGRPRKAAAKRAKEGGTSKRNAVSHRPPPSTALVVVAGRDVPVAPPDDLPEPARDLWTEIVKVLAEAGIIDKIDLPALRFFCLEYGRGYQAKSILDEPVDEDEDRELGLRLEDTKAILQAQKVRVATLLRNNVDVPPSLLNAIATLEVTVVNLESYRATRRKVGNLVALGSTGQMREHPLLGTERDAANLLLRFASRFGLTPADRAALGIDVLVARGLKRELEDELGDARRA